MKKIMSAFRGIGKVFTAPFRGYKKLKKPLKRIISLILVVAVGAGGYFGWNKYKTEKSGSQKQMRTSIVRRGNLTNSITGSGTVEPIEQREIVPEVNGKIIESPFEEGASVKAGDILYRFEMTAATNAIKTAENNVEKARTTLSNRKNSIEKVQENIGKLTVVSTESGKVSDLSLLVGAEASGKICSVTNFKEQTATIPFNVDQVGSIKVGDKATVAIDKYMINTTGSIVRKYTAPDTLSNGAKVHYVEIRLSNDYTVEENINVTATVHTGSGDISSASYGSVKYASPVTINAEQKGKVKKVNFKNGDWVNKGDVIAVLENSDLNEELKNAQQSYNEAQMNLTEALNNLEDKKEAANEYIVTSPIDGVVLTKDFTVGDTVGGQNATSLMVVANMSKMKFTISADELDIAKIQLGQNVSVTADALANQRLSGVITAVSKLGTSSNGVTNYPIEVTIDQPGDLMPGMNVSAQIIVEQSYNSLYLPAEAVEYYDGKYYVTIVGEVENMPEPAIGGNRPGAFVTTNRGGRQEQNDNAQNGQTQQASPRNTQGQPRDNQALNNAVSREVPSNTGVAGQNTPERREGAREGFGGMSHGERPGQNNEAPQAAQPQQENGDSQKNAPRTTAETIAQPQPSTQSQQSAQEAQQKPENSQAQQPRAEQKNETSEKATDAQQKDNETASSEKQGENNFRNRGMNRGGAQEELKIKYYDKEQRVEVKVGIKTDTAYEILEGVSYGQVVKNTAQVTQSGTRTGGMGGGFGGMGGGMGGFGGGMSGGMGGNNRQNRSNMGGRR